MFFKKPDNFTFDVDQCQTDELPQCKIGNYVSFWSPKDNDQLVFIYRRGSIGGTGKIGYVPHKYVSVISKQLQQGLGFETEITDIDINRSLCKIKCRLISREETEVKQSAMKQESSNQLQNDLQKKYTPKQDTILIRINLPKDHKLREGQELYLQQHTMDYYIQNADKLQLKFIDSHGTVVAYKYNEPRLITTLLRALFNRYNIALRIKTIKTLDKYTLKYVDEIEATAEVTFEKQ
jgi:hypothetical protein